ncbi:hypothetical protein A2U01_0084910, partial [Trifolium medium]|nr:hypothetical protein [Trifolium medium]
MKTISVEKDDIVPADQGKTPAPTIAKRLRSQSGKVVASVVTSAKPAKSTKKTVSIGPKKQWSKVVPPSETKKKGL